MASSFFYNSTHSANKKPNLPRVDEVTLGGGSSTKGLFDFLGRRAVDNSRDLGVADVIGTGVASTVVSGPLLRFQAHEQIGTRYLFEIKLNQYLSEPNSLNAEEAANFCLGLKNSEKFKHLPQLVQDKVNKLESVPVVREFIEYRNSIKFIPPQPGYHSAQP